MNYAFYVPEIDLDKSAMERFVHHQREKLVGDRHKRAFDQLSEALTECKFNNPRRIKRILNRYVIYLERFAADQEFLPNAIRLMLIAEYFPTPFQLYMRRSADASLAIKGLLEGKTPVHEFEQVHGVSVAQLLPQMRHMQQLFVELRAPNAEVLNAQIRQIFEITRLF